MYQIERVMIVKTAQQIQNELQQKEAEEMIHGFMQTLSLQHVAFVNTLSSNGIRDKNIFAIFVKVLDLKVAELLLEVIWGESRTRLAKKQWMELEK